MYSTRVHVHMYTYSIVVDPTAGACIPYELLIQEKVPAHISRASVLRARAGTEVLLAIT